MNSDTTPRVVLIVLAFAQAAALMFDAAIMDEQLDDPNHQYLP